MPQAYLRVVGAPPLRFVEATPPPDLVTRPPAAGTPPVLAANQEPELELLSEETTEELTEQTATTEVVDAMPVAESPPTAAAEIRTEPIPASEGPAPILPDDTRPSLQPEDFLPFFQMPGTGRMTSDVTVIAPVPRQAPPPPAQPPSSATYRQTP